MPRVPVRVLFVCTGNSARSILAEALLNHRGRGRFLAYSAGSHPAGRVNPLALAALAERGVAAPGARSKSWAEFAAPGVPACDVVITVCDSAAGEACPIWPGAPLRAHWGVPDPAVVEGSAAARRQAFEAACDLLDHRVRRFVELAIDGLQPAALREQVEEIGRSRPS
ncbi:MAG: arsenate reductase ArsC [Steroidobacteraceae bacterium]